MKRRPVAFVVCRMLLVALVLMALPERSRAEPKDDLVVDAWEYPWSAIGRINAAGRGFCTGFLVAPKAVLTAGHCLYDFRNGRWLQPIDVHFVAGYQRDRQLRHSRAASYRVASDYTPVMEPKIDFVLQDWAVVTLEEPVGETVGWLGVERLDRALMERLQDGQAVIIQASYRRDRPHALSLGFNCSIPGVFGEGQGIISGCDVVEGGSGAPLLVFDAGEMRVLGIHVIRGERNDGEALAGALAASIFHPDGGVPAAARAGREAGLDWQAGHPPAAGGEAALLPNHTIDQLLSLLGYLPEAGEVTLGARAEAIRAFERDNKLPVSGAASVALVGRLIGALR